MDEIQRRHLERMPELSDEMAENRREFNGALAETRRELTETLVVMSGTQSRQVRRSGSRPCGKARSCTANVWRFSTRS